GRAAFLVRVGGGAPADVLAALRAAEGVLDAAPAPGPADLYEVRMALPAGERIAAACSANGWAVHELRPVENRLEDVFRGLTRSGRAAFLVRVGGGAPADVLAALRAAEGVLDAAPAPGPADLYEVRMALPAGERIAAACSANGWAVHELRPVENRLEDVFRGLT